MLLLTDPRTDLHFGDYSWPARDVYCVLIVATPSNGRGFKNGGSMGQLLFFPWPWISYQ